MAPLNLDYLRLRAERASIKSDFLKLKKINNKNICCLKSYVKKNFALATLGGGGGGTPSPKSASVYRLAFKQTLYAKI